MISHKLDILYLAGVIYLILLEPIITEGPVL